MQKLPILLTPEKGDIEREQVLQAWTKLGGTTQKLGKYWIKDERLANKPLAIYGNQVFALVLAQIYNLSLLSPEDTLIARLDKNWTKRNIQMKQIVGLQLTEFPVFIKPVIPKSFQAGVFQTFTEFGEVAQGISENEEILISEIIVIEAEARSYVLEKSVKDISIYEGTADIKEGRKFVEDFVHEHNSMLPKAVVIDVAYNKSLGWFILEFNACWGAGLNGCNAEKVIDCIINATEGNPK